MAGTGTLVLEALFMAANVAPHVLRLKCGLEPRVAQQYPPITRWKHNDIEEDDGGGVVVSLRCGKNCFSRLRHKPRMDCNGCEQPRTEVLML
ncbi:hypothetical protein ACA910_022343 [Epithemia clementina (nom. ined.)]